MNTPTHALVALTALSRRDDKRRNWAVLVGSLIPDLAIFLWAPWQRWGLGRSWSSIWDQHYFEAPMQTLIAVFNSIPIYAVLLLVGMWQRGRVWGILLSLLCVAALLHIALDLPFHGHDAYRHFWPLSDWRFYSPVSYWETDLHARWVSLAEAAVVTGCVFILWQRFPTLWVRFILALLLAFALLAAGLQQLAVIGTGG